MFYASAGQQGQQQQQRGMSMGPSGFPPMSATLGRGGPPGFGSRTATDHNDFPALNASLHAQHSTYSQSQQSQNQPQPQSSQGQQHPYMSGLAPPPPPGIPGPTTSTGGQGSNGGGANGVDRDEFPALGGDKDRMNYMRSQQPTSPVNIPNGASSHPLSATGSGQAPGAGAGAGAGSVSGISGASQVGQQTQTLVGSGGDWARHSPIANTNTQIVQNRIPSGSASIGNVAAGGSEPIVRPVQQILTSPVDKWGLKALLYEITTQMGKTDRGMLMFGEELAELGLDVAPEEPLYPHFVTPWQDPSQIQPSRIQEMYSIPPQYAFNPTQMSAKMGQMSEETLMIAFYSSPQDLVQVEAAAELFARGWRYHMEHQIWLNGPSINQYEPPSPAHSPLSSTGELPSVPGAPTKQSQPPSHRLHGPFLYFNPMTFTRSSMAEDALMDAAAIEWVMPSVAGLEKADGQQGQAQAQAQAQR